MVCSLHTVQLMCQLPEAVENKGKDVVGTENAMAGGRTGVREAARECARAREGARECARAREGARECARAREGARECARARGSARGRERVLGCGWHGNCV